MRLALLLVLVAACGGDDADPHVLTTCEGWVDNTGAPYTGMCETACKKQPTATGMSCDTPAQLNCAAFEFSGIDGCCVPNLAENRIKFVACSTTPK